MRHLHLQLIVILSMLLMSTSAFAEYSWSWTVGCPESGQNNPSATFSANTTTAWTMSGSCTRNDARFTMFNVTANDAPTPNQTYFFGLNNGNILFIPGVLAWETKPIMAIQTQCPVSNKNL